MIKKFLKKIRPGIYDDFERAVRPLVRGRRTRAALNAAYRLLPYSGREWARWHNRLFYAGGGALEPGDWNVRFLGKTVRLPMGRRDPLLEWELALSSLGHDTDVLRTYETLIRKWGGDFVYFDVGANFGLHSVLFLAHGIRTVSFEPNPACHGYFTELCAHNGLAPDLRPFALGRAAGSVKLSFPSDKTWVGTTRPVAKESFDEPSKVLEIEVEIRTLDSFVRDTRISPRLVKIDTEGSELEVLAGASETIASARPAVIFESLNRGAEREALAEFFESRNYGLFALPVLSPDAVRLERRGFQAAAGTNFAAFPRELPPLGGD